MESLTKREVTLSCTVNDYRAPVRWFKGDQEIPVEENPSKYLVEKPTVIGVCKLTILDATLADAGTYKCTIDDTNCVTKCVVKLEGISPS